MKFETKAKLSDTHTQLKQSGNDREKIEKIFWVPFIKLHGSRRKLQKQTIRKATTISVCLNMLIRDQYKH